MNWVESTGFNRGLVMTLMTLDHTRDLVHVASVTRLPPSFSTASPALFCTRWAMHACAPTLFLPGVSAYISSAGLPDGLVAVVQNFAIRLWYHLRQTPWQRPAALRGAYRAAGGGRCAVSALRWYGKYKEEHREKAWLQFL